MKIFCFIALFVFCVISSAAFGFSERHLSVSFGSRHSGFSFGTEVVNPGWMRVLPPQPVMICRPVAYPVWVMRPVPIVRPAPFMQFGFHAHFGRGW